MTSEGGIDDIFLTYNIIGEQKLEELRILSEKVRLSVVADSKQCVEGLAEVFKNANKQLCVFVECDTGAERCGVTNPFEACELAKHIHSKAGLLFGGLMTYPPAGQSNNVNSFLTDAKDLIEKQNISVDVVSIGGSPDMWNAGQIPIATEYRIGTYIFNDRSLIIRGVCEETDCALAVRSTVISTPTETRAVIDAGSKTLTSDLFGLAGYGYVINHPELDIYQLSEEHGIIRSKNPTGLKIGQVLTIIPNHACVVSNMASEVIFTRGRNYIKTQSVVARGTVW
jgi:D-serine deaminase-like pyridoxal phosphate-dependent protein